MNEKEMNKPTRPISRQNKNKARDKGLLVVGWMTRAVVHGDASTLGMAGLDFTRMLIFLRWQVRTWETKALTCAQTKISLLSFWSGPNHSCLNCAQIEGSETIPPKHAFHWASSVANMWWCSKKDLSSYKTGSKSSYIYSFCYTQATAVRLAYPRAKL